MFYVTGGIFSKVNLKSRTEMLLEGCKLPAYPWTLRYKGPFESSEGALLCPSIGKSDFPSIVHHNVIHVWCI